LELPQATRANTITRASSSARNFFMEKTSFHLYLSLVNFYPLIPQLYLQKHYSLFFSKRQGDFQDFANILSRAAQ